MLFAAHRPAVSRLSAGLATFLMVAGCSPGGLPAASNTGIPAANPPPTAAAAPPASASTATPNPSAGAASFDAQFADLIKAAKGEGQLTWYQSLYEAGGTKYAADFQSKFGIKVNVIFATTEATLQRFLSEERAGQHLADVVSLADTAPTMQVMQEGLFVKYDARDEAKFPEGWVLHTNGATAYPTTRLQMAILYNPKLVTSQADLESLQRWEGLLDPRWANSKVGIADVTKVGSVYPTYYMWLVGQKDKFGEEFVRKLGLQKPVIYPGMTQEGERVTAGEVSVGLATDVVAMWSYGKGAPIAWTYPAPTPVSLTYSGISKSAPHANAARLFLEYLADEEGMLTWAKDWEGATGRPDLDKLVPLKYVNEPWYKAPSSYFTISDLDAAAKANAAVVKQADALLH